MKNFSDYKWTVIIGLVSFILLYALPSIFVLGYQAEPFVGILFCPLLGIYGAYRAMQEEEMGWMIANVAIIPIYYIYTSIVYQIWIR